MLAPILCLWRSPPAQASATYPLVKEARAALARAEPLLSPPDPLPAPAAPAPVMGKLLVLPLPRRRPAPPLPEPEEETSAWDPEQDSSVVRLVREADEGELLQQSINGTKTLLLEIIRRAAYDWVLYRNSRRMVQRSMAEQAYRWLFVENPGTPDWTIRQRDGKHITSFISICEGLDLDPDTARRHIKRLTPRNVMSVGRPAEYRRRDVFTAQSGDDVYETPGMLIEYDDGSSEEPSY
jgi:hypothetical protein